MADFAESDLEIEWDMAALGRAAGLSEDTREAVEAAADEIAGRANSLGAGHVTKIWRDPKTGERKGGTQARYGSKIRTGQYAHVGIVHTANYSAMQDNAESNTLLKARG